MQKSRKYLVTLFIFIGLFSVSVSAGADAVTDNAKSIAWTDNNLAGLNKVFKDTATVNAFIHSLQPDTDPQPNVGEFQLVDLHRDGKVELVVTVAFSRAFYNHIYVVSRNGDEFELAVISTGGPTVENLKSSIVDLNEDGRKQILVPRALAPYAGIEPIPVTIDVYAWNGSQYDAANAQFGNYYRNVVLPKLYAALDRIQKGQETKDPETMNILKNKYQKEIQAVKETIGQ